MNTQQQQSYREKKLTIKLKKLRPRTIKIFSIQSEWESFHSAKTIKKKKRKFICLSCWKNLFSKHLGRNDIQEHQSQLFSPRRGEEGCYCMDACVYPKSISIGYKIPINLHKITYFLSRGEYMSKLSTKQIKSARKHICCGGY